MPSRDEDASYRRVRKEDDSPRTKEKTRDKTRIPAEQKHSAKQSSPEKVRLYRVPSSGLSSRVSMTDLPSRQKPVAVSAAPEMNRRASVGEPNSGSYPAFSKEHSREAVRPAQEGVKSKISVLSPGPTEARMPERPKSTRPYRSEHVTRAPPSPPLTADEEDIRRAHSSNSKRTSGDYAQQDAARRNADLGARSRASHLKEEGRASPRRTTRVDDADIPSGTAEALKLPVRHKTSSKYLPRNSGDRDRREAHSMPTDDQESLRAASNSDSQATSVAPERTASRPSDHVRPARATPPQRPLSAANVINSAIPPHMVNEPYRSFSQPQAAPRSPVQSPDPAQAFVNGNSFMPSAGETAPPPPPPMNLPDENPRVDYLLHNGGLAHTIPRSLFATSTIPDQKMGQLGDNDIASRIFTPINKRLEDLNQVLSRNGSVAVATGYRSVARRLLDRLENVFARNIASERCHCALCNSLPAPELSSEEQDGISWGEILEFVSGRRALPQWPPFTLGNEAQGPEITGRVDTPMQKLDPDVPEEYRQHYMRQNDKTKRSVQNWLLAQTMDAVQPEPPHDVDDETLSFAMLTRLDTDKRASFTALMLGHGSLHTNESPNASCVNSNPDDTTLEKTSLALQRLYRLSGRPRRPECTIYLLNNTELHGMLATLAAISPTEWDILTSGRFDGFLWSGAETGDALPNSTVPLRLPSRGPTPHFRGGIKGNISRGPTPFSAGSFRGATPLSTTTTTTTAAGGPVQLDEETEVAVLGELERAIYHDMSLLEDAFEAVHQQAEAMRSRLVARAAGLLMAAQARRGGGDAESDFGARMDTPASAYGAQQTPLRGYKGDDAASTVFLDDVASELAPDDSASNIEFVRRRRGHGGKESDGGLADRRRRR